MSEPETVVFDAEVVCHVQILLEDGSVVEDTRESGEPLVFVVGDGTFPEGIELMFYGLQAGEKESRSFSAPEAWGMRDEERIELLPWRSFDEDFMPSVGEPVAFDMPDDEEYVGQVIEVSEEGVRVDFNSPLAGKAVCVDVEIIAILAPEECAS